MPHQESTNPSQEALPLHPKIRDLTEMVNRKSFYGIHTSTRTSAGTQRQEQTGIQTEGSPWIAVS